MPADAPAPAPSAEARRLIDELFVSQNSADKVALSAYVADLEAEVTRWKVRYRDREKMLIWDDEILKGPERLRLDRRIRDQRMSIRMLWHANTQLRKDLDAAQRGRAAAGGGDGRTA